jgi:hypothetical protein
MSLNDQKWTEDVFKQAFGGKAFSDVSFFSLTVNEIVLMWNLTDQFIRCFCYPQEVWGNIARSFKTRVCWVTLFDFRSSPSLKAYLLRIKRGPDGKFSDDDIARILQDATDCAAGAFRGKGTPEVLRIAEIMGIEQARRWGLCTMNEFRKFLGLRRAYFIPFAMNIYLKKHGSSIREFRRMDR